jgi:hypothetical protein
MHSLSYIHFTYEAYFLTSNKHKGRNFKENAAMQFNKTCKIEPLTPKYLQEKVNGKRLNII